MKRFRNNHSFSSWLYRVTGTHGYVYTFLRTMAVVAVIALSIVVAFICYGMPLVASFSANNAAYLLLYILTIPVGAVYAKFLCFHMEWEF